MRHNQDMFHARSIAVLMIILVGGAAPRAQTAPVPEALNCPDQIVIDPRQDLSGDRVREIAPKSGAHTSDAFAADARFARLAYLMFEAFNAGKDPRVAFKAPDQLLVGLIYGDPAPHAERPDPRLPELQLAKPLPAALARPETLRKDSRTLYGFVAEDRATGRRTIAFRGTMQPAEWVRNAQALQRPYPSGTAPRLAAAHVHDGFLRIFESLQYEANARVSTSAPIAFAAALPGLVSGHDTVFVGHSLGSAIATLAGVEATRRSPNMAWRMRIVTLASPRVGDAGFAAMARAVGRIDRVCNLVDIVTAVPASTEHLHYVHVGHPFRVSSFDWPDLNNAMNKRGEQILCWHGDQSYAHMLSPATSPATPQCAR